MLLAKGKIVYFNQAKLAVDYFSGLGDFYKCPDWNNPADFFMDFLNIESIDTKDGSSQKGFKPKSKILEEFD